LRVLVVLRLAAVFFFAGAVAGFASVAALLAGFIAAFVVVAPVRVVAGASIGSTAPPPATQEFQPPSNGRTFVKP
jgi:uncharacterized membrane protein required for colicin V production